MQILIDDSPVSTLSTHDLSVRQVAHQALRDVSSRENPRWVVSLYCDGVAISPDHLEDVLAQPAEQFQQLQFQTQPLHSLTGGLAAQIGVAIRDTKHLATQTADLLAKGEIQDGMRHLQELLDAWKQIQEATQAYLEALAAAGEAAIATAALIPENCVRFKGLIGELSSAVSTRDFVLMQDLLRYELPEAMTQWAGDLAVA